jgi:hypothetical protein
LIGEDPDQFRALMEQHDDGAVICKPRDLQNAESPPPMTLLLAAPNAKRSTGLTERFISI